MSIGGSQTTASTQPYGPAIGGLNNILGNAGSLYGQQYPTMGMSPITQGALGLTAERALNGSPLLQTAQNTTQNIAGGYGGTNPYLNTMADTALGKVRDMVNSQFEAAGRFNSGANQQELTRNLGEVAGNIYGGQYNADQNRMLAASQIAPYLANQDFTQLQQLLGVGQTYDQAPWNLLNNYANPITSIASAGKTATTTDPGQSAIPSLLGGLISNPGGLGGLFGGMGDIFGSQGVGGLSGILGTTGGWYDGGLGGPSFAGSFGGSGLLGSLGSIF